MDFSVAKNKDFLDQLLDLMNKRMDGLEAKLDANTATTQAILAQAKNTNGRVKKAEDDIKRLESVRGKKFSLEPRTMYLLALGFVLVLFIVAALLHVDIGGLL